MKTALAFGVLFLIIGAAELRARLGPDKRIPPAWAAVLKEWPESQAYLRDYQRLKSGFRSRDYYLYEPAEARTPTINFYSDGTRATPDDSPSTFPKPRNQMIVWAFGGSTMEEVGTTDRLTIANQIAVNLKRRGMHVRIRNYGASGFHSTLESVKFLDLLRRTNPESWPDVVVFYDGFNDTYHAVESGPGRIQWDLQKKVALLVERRWFTLAAYAGIRALTQTLRSTVPLEWWFTARFLPPPERSFSKERLNKAASLYLMNLRIARAVCREFGIRPVFILQPLLITKQGHTDLEASILRGMDQRLVEFGRDFYRIVSESNPGDVHDLSGLFDHSGSTDFVDYGHTAPMCGVKTGAQISRIIAAQN